MRQLHRFLAIGLFSLTTLAPPGAHASETHCFEKHLRDAIVLNQARLPLYSRESGGASALVSWLLIGSEELTLLTARKFDAEAELYQRHGIGLMCDEFASMDTVPGYSAADRGRPSRPIPKLLRAFPTSQLVKQLLSATAKSDEVSDEPYAELSTVATKHLNDLEDSAAYFCSTRHILESIIRAANLSPLHETQARWQELPSTLSLTRRYLEAQIHSLRGSIVLDRLSAKLHHDGLKILCQDVPKISPR
ncbi:MAG: hypothetical protein H7222_00850 [Methylotenera sp.]|nr:hypothetical protein [Oligoflexia bacterium]